MTKFFKGLWYGLNLSRKIFLNLMFFILLIMLISAIANSDKRPKIEDGITMLLQPNGYIVEQLTYVDPIDKAMQEATNSKDAPETLLYDLTKALSHAKSDKRISSVTINTDYMWGAGVTKLQDLASAIKDFKSSGKKVYAYGDHYSQAQYFLAAQADEVILNPQGGIFILGFSSIRSYFKSFLNKLGINVHVFKVGTYKSAVEPFIRDNMSDAAKKANRAWMGDLWSEFQQQLAASRSLDASNVSSYINNYKENLIANKGNAAQLALNAKLVDSIMSRVEFRNKMIKLVGMDDESKSFRSINHEDYLNAIKSPVNFNQLKADNKVAVITAKGVIFDGEHKEGVIGGDTIARLIRKTRNDEKVKAIVLRVDSPGGSAFASEIIRQELVKAQEEGIVVVTSMADVAASGGYWIAATSDEIWAKPSTITGSIGIFGMIPTFEKPLNEWGIFRDGVGTTKYANPVDAGLPLSQDVAEIIQTSINAGYDSFLNIVSQGRNMTKKAVNKIAKGRVWSGIQAHKLGLVDKLGGLQDAIKSAADLAGIKEYDVQYITRTLTENEIFLNELFNQSQIQELVQQKQMTRSKATIKNTVLNQIKAGFNTLNQWNDPNHIYANCFCELQSTK